MKNAKFEILCPPSLNEQRKWSIGQRTRFKNGLALEMLAALRASGVWITAADRLQLATSPVKRTVKLTRYFGGRVQELDRDNLIGGCKPVVDQLKLVTWKGSENGVKFERPGLGLIFDDKDQYVCAMYDQVPNKDKAGYLLVEVA